MSDEKKGPTFTKIVLEVFKVSGMLNNEGDKMTREFGLTSSRWKILGAIALSQQPLTVPQIGRSMGQSRQAVQKLVDLMIKDDMLQLVDNPNHKRAKYVALTEKAKGVYQQLEQTQTPWAQQSTDEISLQELETTLDVLNKIAKRFSQT